MSHTEGSEQATQARCGHATCSCLVLVSEAIIAGDRFFCAASCARGEGCGHERCNCAQTSRHTRPAQE